VPPAALFIAESLGALVGTSTGPLEATVAVVATLESAGALVESVTDGVTCVVESVAGGALVPGWLGVVVTPEPALPVFACVAAAALLFSGAAAVLVEFWVCEPWPVVSAVESVDGDSAAQEHSSKAEIERKLTMDPGCSTAFT
jgi:hypothetical protein